MRRLFAICSIVVHTLVIGAAFVAQLIAVGPLPIPRTPITFVGAIPITIIEPPPPPPAQAARSTQHSTTSPDIAPVIAPDGVTPETPNERRATPPSTIAGFEGGVPNSWGLGVERVPPPPPPPPPQRPIRLHSGMQAPRRVVNVDPVYPRVAQTARIEGVVILEAVIDAQGRVETVRVLRSIPLLDQAAADAVKAWIFTPALLNGMPVPVVMTVTVNFTLATR